MAIEQDVFHQNISDPLFSSSRYRSNERGQITASLTCSKEREEAEECAGELAVVGWLSGQTCHIGVSRGTEEGK